MATPLDLFRAFDNQSNFNTPLPKDVKMAQILKTWTEEAGYPVVTIQLADKTATVYQVGKNISFHSQRAVHFIEAEIEK